MTKVLPPKPEISPAFTMEDIRKIRDWQYECSKLMTPEEYVEWLNAGAMESGMSEEPPPANAAHG